MKASTAQTILGIVILVVILGFVYTLAGRYHMPPAATVPVSTSSNPFDAGCGGCRGPADNNTSSTVAETSRITIALPSDGYDPQALTISPTGVFGETFGASAPAGYWVRTFEAVRSGTATFRVPARSPQYPDYALTVNVTAAPQATSTAMVSVTRADDGGTVDVRKGSRFLLNLGDLQWTISISDPSVISRVPNISVIRGAQGVYNALKAGTTTISAEGRPACDPSSMCPQYVVEFNAVIRVVP